MADLAALCESFSLIMEDTVVSCPLTRLHKQVSSISNQVLDR